MRDLKLNILCFRKQGRMFKFCESLKSPDPGLLHSMPVQGLIRRLKHCKISSPDSTHARSWWGSENVIWGILAILCSSKLTYRPNVWIMDLILKHVTKYNSTVQWQNQIICNRLTWSMVRIRSSPINNDPRHFPEWEVLQRKNWPPWASPHLPSSSSGLTTFWPNWKQSKSMPMS